MSKEHIIVLKLFFSQLFMKGQLVNASQNNVKSKLTKSNNVKSKLFIPWSLKLKGKQITTPESPGTFFFFFKLFTVSIDDRDC